MRKKRRGLILLLAVALIATSVPQLSVEAAGNARKEQKINRYNSDGSDRVISTEAELKDFLREVEEGASFLNKTVTLAKDIQVTANQLEPTWSNSFEGTFDGAGHSISGINMNWSGASVGLFYVIGKSGTVKNLTLKRCSISTAGMGRVGAIAAINRGVISNCTVQNSVITHGAKNAGNVNSEESSFAGGIAGVSTGRIFACKNINTAVRNNCSAGGIVGYNTGTLMNCFSSGDISTLDTAGRGAVQGGIAAYSSGDIVNCANTGNIVQTYSDNGFAGGIVGKLVKAAVKNCYFVGELDVPGATFSSGSAVGYASGAVTLKNCYYRQDGKSLYGSKDGKVTESDNHGFDLEDMKQDVFVKTLNTNCEPGANWLPWVIRSGSDFPQHVVLYPISIDYANYGTVTCTTDYSYRGANVIFTVTANTNYKVKSVKVTAASGEIVDVTKANDKYSFKMPGSAVTITVNYVFAKPITGCDFSLDKKTYIYDGQAKKPEVTVVDGMMNLKKGHDYSVKYYSNINAGTAKLVVIGEGDYDGKKEIPFTIKKAPQGLKVNSVSLKVAYGCTPFSLGATTEKGPGKITYSISDKKIAKVDNTGKVTVLKPGNAVITVVAKGNRNYEEENQVIKLEVSPKDITDVRLQTLNGRQLQITWPKASEITGYEVQYSLDKEKWTTRKVNNAGDNPSLTLTDLTAGKCYYVRVRSYRKVGNDYFYSQYSEIQQSAIIEYVVTPQIGNCQITLSQKEYTYNGTARIPAVEVKYGVNVLTKDIDYTLSYSNNKDAGTAKVVIAGKGSYGGTITKYYTIKQVEQKISCKTEFDKTFGDKSFRLGAKLKNGGSKLTYKSSNTKVATVSGAGNVTLKGPGVVVITITAAGSKNYRKDEMKVTITVKPKKVALTSVTAIGKRQMTISWERDSSATGYIVEYSANAKMSNPTKEIVKSNATVSRTYSSLTVGKAYYVRVTAYKTMKVGGKDVTIYGKSSDIKRSGTITK